MANNIIVYTVEKFSSYKSGEHITGDNILSIPDEGDISRIYDVGFVYFDLYT